MFDCPRNTISLKNLCAKLNIEYTDEHRALADSEMLYLCVNELIIMHNAGDKRIVFKPYNPRIPVDRTPAESQLAAN
jgi:DNA polymerase III epsilon subunit-like protein